MAKRFMGTITARTGGLIALVVLASASVPTPTAAQPPAGGDLTGVVWQWQETIANVDPLMPPDPSLYTIEFNADGSLGIRADCNRGGGTYTLDYAQITIRVGPATLIACPPGSLGDQFLGQLADAAIAASDGTRLAIGLQSSQSVMIFHNPAAPATGSGTVTYGERIALPPDAVVRVSLGDASRAATPATILGEQAIDARGRQVPFAFSIS